MIGSVGSAVAGIASKVAGFFGLSPAVEGPLSGGGAPEIRGRHFADALASGMLGGLPGVAASAGRVASAAGIGPGRGAGGGDVVIRIQPGGSGLDRLFMDWLKYSIRTGGGDPRILTSKVRFA
jgi:hypothetical protein